ncbi:hypothetical protein BDR26DRAFT_922111 [Obelidium mucronatum]|nr:hypothetical protein BDR26DRAFT_922111 [Obelidium mucronatum]
MGAGPRYAADGKTAMPAAKYKAKEWTPQDMALLLDLVKADPELTGSDARSRHPQQLALFETSTLKSKINACITNLWDDEMTNPPLYSSVATPTKKPALQENLSENFQMGPNLRPPDRKLGAGSNIVLHDLVWYQEDGKYYYMVYIYNMEGMKLTFQISPDACSLECRYTPRLKAPNYDADPTHDCDSLRNVSVYQYFGNAGAEQFTCFIHFPYPVERDPLEKVHHLSEKVVITGVSHDSSLVTVKAARPGGIVLIYRLAGQTSQVTTQIEYEIFGVLLEE